MQRSICTSSITARGETLLHPARPQNLRITWDDPYKVAGGLDLEGKDFVCIGAVDRACQRPEQQRGPGPHQPAGRRKSFVAITAL